MLPFVYSTGTFECTWGGETNGQLAERALSVREIIIHRRKNVHAENLQRERIFVGERAKSICAERR